MNAAKYVLVTVMLCASATAFVQTSATTLIVVAPEQKEAVKELLDAMNFKKSDVANGGSNGGEHDANGGSNGCR